MMKVDDAEVVALAREGYTVREIAARLGVHERTVERARKRTGTTTQWNRAGLAPLEERLQRARLLREDGVPAAEVSRMVRLHLKTMRRCLPAELLVSRRREAASLQLYERKMWPKIEAAWAR